MGLDRQSGGPSWSEHQETRVLVGAEYLVPTSDLLLTVQHPWPLLTQDTFVACPRMTWVLEQFPNHSAENSGILGD